MAIYTRSGDNGMTGLASGQRVHKDSPIIEFVGRLDELNSILGVCVAHLEDAQHDFTEECQVLESIQSDLFAVGAISVGSNMQFNVVKEISNIEKTIDDYEKLLKPLRNFILPGGTIPASHLHYARTLVRNVERDAVAVKSKSLNEFLPYLNRLSDLLFVMARYVNRKMSIDEVIWKG